MKLALNLIMTAVVVTSFAINLCGCNSSKGASHGTAAITSATDDHGHDIATSTREITEKVISGKIEIVGDRDLFLIDLPSDGSYELNYDSNQEILAAVYTDSFALLKTSTGEKGKIPFMRGNAIFVSIESNKNSAGGEYTFEIRRVFTTADKVIVKRAKVYELQLGSDNTRLVDTLPNQWFDGIEIISATQGEVLHINNMQLFTLYGLSQFQANVFDEAKNSADYSTPVSDPQRKTSFWDIQRGISGVPLVSLISRGDRANVQLITDGSGLDGQDHLITLHSLAVQLDNGVEEKVYPKLPKVKLLFREFNRVVIRPYAPIQNTATFRSANTTIADFDAFNTSVAHVNSVTSLTVNVKNPPTGITNYRIRSGGKVIAANSVAGASNEHQVTFLLGADAIEISKNLQPGGASVVIQVVADTTACSSGDVVNVIAQWAVADSASGATDTPIHSILDPNTNAPAEFRVTLQ